MSSLYFAVGLWLLVHWSYVLIMAAKAARDAGRLTTYWTVMLVPVGIAGWALDFIFQMTLGWWMFALAGLLDKKLEHPFRGGLLFSGRVQYHYSRGTGKRKDLANFFARNLNVFDDHIK